MDFPFRFIPESIILRNLLLRNTASSVAVVDLSSETVIWVLFTEAVLRVARLVYAVSVLRYRSSSTLNSDFCGLWLISLCGE